MNIIGDVFKELFKMFVADLRLTLAILGGIIVVWILLHKGLIGPLPAGLLLTFYCFIVLAEAVIREARQRSQR